MCITFCWTLWLSPFHHVGCWIYTLITSLLCPPILIPRRLQMSMKTRSFCCWRSRTNTYVHIKPSFHHPWYFHFFLNKYPLNVSQCHLPSTVIRRNASPPFRKSLLCTLLCVIYADVPYPGPRKNCVPLEKEALVPTISGLSQKNPLSRKNKIKQ